MNELAALFLRAAFVDNMPLTLFLGLCTFIALSRRTGSAVGLGIAMIAVLGVTVPLNNLIYHALLAPGAWAWAGSPGIDLSYLALIAFIGVIAATVQLLEMVLDRFFPAVYASFGVFLPLLTVQCAILAGSLFMVERDFDFVESTVFGLGAGTGFAVAVIMLGAIRTRLSYANLPEGLRGLGITFIIAGMMSLGFSAFAQMVAS
ncbi:MULTISPECIES: NADH:ubiquinone reductase (Na(+)-transporting) subunit E [Alphaproteobacteria]|uniref:NADH:ubiquinone reductase (Na(+)-transporting) subunit E n=1 Tax=Alphaproteobacteria TaxID=28211 RepID=UPI000DDE9267|nr:MULTISPECIES: NADH:ubiquinone reductase (Na(+)-transporting) subunit E [Alphaproteobacteria]MBY6022991.1 NADH:ubiquinone reductase (Na(+)-transporting) subunit E [Nitratireductor sp. DP7N14-4]MBN7758198.1 NADH:ubiquinone reductase (Na(+)-transporting) subunit E [Nitratireductor aquimarinus]MBN7760330.1 NADH:ubiquinone reductase (Na(+)-transporting) subunit E [Nitratireductor aquibiodomus]MBN7776204.1 NADH:ubiquinone reductase (Na(+)-transporting) subunit E [Nitratireductor pacificus]MBN7779